MLNHIGLTIIDSKEIKNFYEDILGFRIVRKFEINKELAYALFKIEQSAEVVSMERNGTFLEIFISNQPEVKNFNHICFNIQDRKQFLSKAELSNYQFKVIPRNDFDLVFIYDKSGNIFELKESD
jgi:catechol 2,3-dioxygenase-like lactoylglutathione lyase family enzyme